MWAFARCSALAVDSQLLRRSAEWAPALGARLEPHPHGRRVGRRGLIDLVVMDRNHDLDRQRHVFGVPGSARPVAGACVIVFLGDGRLRREPVCGASVTKQSGESSYHFVSSLVPLAFLPCCKRRLSTSSRPFSPVSPCCQKRGLSSSASCLTRSSQTRGQAREAIPLTFSTVPS